jgi:hypothetical protein
MLWPFFAAACYTHDQLAGPVASVTLSLAMFVAHAFIWLLHTDLTRVLSSMLH